MLTLHNKVLKFQFFKRTVYRYKAAHMHAHSVAVSLLAAAAAAATALATAEITEEEGSEAFSTARNYGDSALVTTESKD